MRRCAAMAHLSIAITLALRVTLTLGLAFRNRSMGLTYRDDHAQSEEFEGMTPLDLLAVSHGTQVRLVQPVDEFDLDFCGAAVHSNLGGLGPGSGAAELRFVHVGTFKDTSVDLVIVNTTEYLPHDIYRNGARRCFGVLNLVKNATVGLRYSLVETGTDIPVTVDRFYFSIFDLDCSSTGAETMTFHEGFSRYYVDGSTELGIRSEPPSLTFVASTYGDGSDNPPPFQVLQKSRAVTMEYESASQWFVTFKVSASKEGRNVLIGGKTSLVTSAVMSQTTRPPRKNDVATTVPPRKRDQAPTVPPRKRDQAPTVPPRKKDVAPTVPPRKTHRETVAPTPAPRIRDPTTTQLTKPIQTTTTTTPGSTQCTDPGSCVIWGDPHVLSFDVHRKRHATHPRQEAFFRTKGWKSDELNIYDEGTFWLVKSDQVRIQGRYWHSKGQKEWTSLGAVAVSGPFLKNNTLVLRPLSDTTTWNGEEILPFVPSSFENELIRAKFHAHAELVANGKAGLGIDIDLPGGVHLTVNRWQFNLAVRLDMCRQLSGQDGQCGNFNGNASDDLLPSPDHERLSKAEFLSFMH